jgi:uncharacterized protein
MRIKLCTGTLCLALLSAAQANAGPYDDAHAAHLKGDWKTYEQIIRPLAERGETRAQNDMGEAYLTGWGPPQDYAQAMLWFRKAADQGDPDADLSIGTMYKEGQGVAKDEAQAIDWFTKAARQGNEMARPLIMLLCVTDKPAGDACKAAANDLEAAAEKGDGNSQAELATFYDSGQFPGIAKDPERALQWYRKAADGGLPGAQTALALRYEMGLGAPQDKAQALSWYLKAAQGGEMLAQMSLARRYEDPGEPDHDDAKAFYWNSKLAGQGIADAQRKIAVDYATGRGTARDDVKAYAWLTVAGQDRNATGTDALALQTIAARLTPAQLADAKRQAEALKASQDGH